MTGVAAYLALIIVIPALLLGHHGEDWPLTGAWRWLRAYVRRELPPHAPQEHRDAQKPTQPRVPSWAHTDRHYEEAA